MFKYNISFIRKITCLLLALSIFSSILPVKAQEGRQIEITAQEILARVDSIMAYPNGQLKGEIKHITPDGKSSINNFKASIARENSLFQFASIQRGEQLRVLYNLNGEDVWVYSPLSIQLFHKMDIDKYDPILATNFTYIDLSNADLQSNYIATITGPAIVRGQDALKLDLQPIYKKGAYGKLTLYVAKTSYLPLRIDYHDVDNVIYKTLALVQLKEEGKRVFPVRYDMLNIAEGTVTIMNINEIDSNAVFSPEIFMHQNLGNKN